MAKAPLFSRPTIGDRRKVAALDFGFDWNGGRGLRVIGDGVRAGGLRGSQVGRLYRRLCVEHNIDDGEPASFDFFIEFSDWKQLLGFDRNANSPILRCLTRLCILVAAPLSSCRLIWSRDDFATAESTNLLFDFRHQSDHWDLFLLDNKRPTKSSVVDPGLCRALQTSWVVPGKPGRLSRALSFFQHAWLAHDRDLM